MLNNYDIEIQKNKMGFNNFQGNCIYFLLKSDEVVYVGQSTRGLSRIFEHSINKDFDSFSYIPVEDPDDLVEMEAKFICLFLPKYNHTIPYLKFDSIDDFINQTIETAHLKKLYKKPQVTEKSKKRAQYYLSEKVKCPICGKLFLPGRGHRGKKKYCSLECAYKRRTGMHTNRL